MGTGTDSEKPKRARAEEDLEMAVLKKIVAELRRMPTNRDRQRVWDYVGARLLGEALVEKGEPPAE